MDGFQIVIGKADSCKGTRRENCDPDKPVSEIRPQNRGHNDSNCDQQPPHGWRACFSLVRLGPLVADVLADLKFAEAIDYQWPDNQPGEQGSETGKGGAKCKIAKNPKRREIMVELQIQQPIEQCASVLIPDLGP